MTSAAMFRASEFAAPPTREALVRMALRTRSSAARDPLALGASSDRWTYGELLGRLRNGEAHGSLKRSWLTSLARVVALQSRTAADLEDAAVLFTSVPESALDLESRRMLARLVATLEGPAEAQGVALRLGLTFDADPFLHLNLGNPWLQGSGTASTTWRRQLRRAFAAAGLAKTALRETLGMTPFDSVSASVTGGTTGPLVSVVMTTYRPGPSLLTAVRSIARQTWRDLEILIIDDGSGPDATEMLKQACALDPRARLIRLPENRGTYAARNAGIGAARGTFITGHDDDDWAHPSRIERQVQPLLDVNGPVATLSQAVWASDDLEVSPLGWPAVGRYAPSYMTRLETVRAAGGYIEARKAADTELIRRIEAISGQPTYQIDEALSLYRTRRGSLSRDDFRPAWDHPARVAFWQLSKDVHDRIRVSEFTARDATERIAVPARFADQARRRFDVVVAADWRSRVAGAVSPLLHEVRALAESGLRVGVLQMEDGTRAAEGAPPLDPALIRAVNERLIDLVFLDDEADVDTVLIRHAGCLAFPPQDASRLVVGRTTLVVEGRYKDASSQDALSALGYYVRAAERVFGVLPTVVPDDDVTRQALRIEDSSGASVRLDGRVYLGVVDDDLLTRPRPGALVGTPVVGAVGWHRGDWPDGRTAKRVFGTSELDVRLLGGALPPAVVQGLGQRSYLHLDAMIVTAAEFLAQVDFFCHFPDRRNMFGWINLALAAGCVVIAAPEHRTRYQDAVVYSTPGHVRDVYAAFVRDPVAYREQVRRGRRYAITHLRAGATARVLPDRGSGGVDHRALEPDIALTPAGGFPSPDPFRVP